MILEYGSTAQGTCLVFYEKTLLAKECSKCFCIKPTSQFHRTKAHSTGTVSFCKLCVKHDHAKRRKNTRIRDIRTCAAGIPVEYKCRCCAKFKLAGCFYKHKKGKDGLSEKCKDCISALGAEYRSKNKDKIKKRSKHYYIKNKHKHRLHGRKRRYALRHQKTIIRYFENEIADMLKGLSEFKRTDKSSLVVDHIIPINHPRICGLHCPANLRIVTASENSSKQNKWDGTYDNTNWKTNWRDSL